MKKPKAPYFTYPRIPLPSRPAEKDDMLPRRLGAHQIFSIEFFRLIQSCFDQGAKISILDLISGNGDYARLAANICRTRKIQPTIEMLGSPKDTLERLGQLAPASFDVVICCSALHLFTLEKAVALIAAMDRVAKTAWFAQDLQRTRALTMVAEAVSQLGGKAMKNVTPLTQQAFNARELKNLAFHAGVADYAWRSWALHQVMLRHKR